MPATRGERWFVRFPRFAAALYDRLMAAAPIQLQFREMTYDVDQYAGIFQQTPFAGSFSLDKISLAQLPIWLRITLIKPAGFVGDPPRTDSAPAA